MSQMESYLELDVHPLPPKVRGNVGKAFLADIERVLGETNNSGLLESGDLRMQVQKHYPDTDLVVILINFGTSVASSIFAEVVLGEVKKRWQVKERDKGDSSDESSDRK